jgi:hypothetical protein
MAADRAPEVAQALGALARCHARFADATFQLGLRDDVTDARRKLYVHPAPGGARAELGVWAFAGEERGAQVGHWQLTSEWSTVGWVVDGPGVRAPPIRRVTRYGARSTAAGSARVARRAGT